MTVKSSSQASGWSTRCPGPSAPEDAASLVPLPAASGLSMSAHAAPCLSGSWLPAEAVVSSEEGS
eukprot:3554582-Heterocapsa_arctica.AAC.1